MLPAAWKKEIQNSIDEAETRSANENKHRDEEQKTVSAAIESLACELKRHNAAQEKAEPGKRRRENWTIGALIAAAIFTFVLSILSALQLHEMEKVYGPIKDSSVAANKQIGVMQQQGDMIASDQRPWIALRKIEFIKDMIFDNNDAQVGVRYVIANTGKSPALQVVLYGFLFLPEGLEYEPGLHPIWMTPG
jgi:hypothetical protein